MECNGPASLCYYRDLDKQRRINKRPILQSAAGLAHSKVRFGSNSNTMSATLLEDDSLYSRSTNLDVSAAIVGFLATCRFRFRQVRL